MKLDRSEIWNLEDYAVKRDLPPAQVVAAKAGAKIAIGIDHPALPYRADPVPETVRANLAGDLD